MGSISGLLDGGAWTRLIDEKYVLGPAVAAHSSARTAHPRVVIRLRPDRLVAVGSV
jgi:hypothetical protein